MCGNELPSLYLLPNGGMHTQYFMDGVGIVITDVVDVNGVPLAYGQRRASIFAWVESETH